MPGAGGMPRPRRSGQVLQLRRGGCCGGGAAAAAGRRLRRARRPCRPAINAVRDEKQHGTSFVTAHRVYRCRDGAARRRETRPRTSGPAAGDGEERRRPAHAPGRPCKLSDKRRPRRETVRPVVSHRGSRLSTQVRRRVAARQRRTAGCRGDGAPENGRPRGRTCRGRGPGAPENSRPRGPDMPRPRRSGERRGRGIRDQAKVAASMTKR